MLPPQRWFLPPQRSKGDYRADAPPLPLTAQPPFHTPSPHGWCHRKPSATPTTRPPFHDLIEAGGLDLAHVTTTAAFPAANATTHEPHAYHFTTSPQQVGMPGGNLESTSLFRRGKSRERRLLGPRLTLRPLLDLDGCPNRQSTTDHCCYFWWFLLW